MAVIDAEKLINFVGNPELRPFATEAKRKLQTVVEKVLGANMTFFDNV